jgi:hypothetical protein
MLGHVPILCTSQYGFFPDMDAITLLDPFGNSALAQAAKSWIVEAMQPLYNPRWTQPSSVSCLSSS